MDGVASAYQSELCGLYAPLALVAAICRVHEVKNGALQISCNNDGALQVIQPKTTRVPVCFEHFDVVCVIRRVKQAISLRLSYIEVQGHLDDRVLFLNLSIEARLNVLCDGDAKIKLDWEHERGTLKELLPHEGVIVHILGNKIVGSSGKDLLLHAKLPIMKELYSCMNWLSTAAFSKVDWHPLCVWSEQTTDLYKVWLTTHLSKTARTFVMSKNIGDRKSVTCP